MLAIETQIEQIKKRDGRIVKFEPSKITEAIWKAIKATGSRDRTLAENLSIEVVRRLESLLPPGSIPSVEDIQDIVERTLIEKGEARIAKAYILYRQKRAELREEKKKILEKDQIDEVDKTFDINALRVLKARYLRKDESGTLKETPKQLFTRVAIHTTLPSIFYDYRIFDKDGKQEVKEASGPLPETLKIGTFILNEFHIEALRRLYDRFNMEGRLKVGWSQLMQMFQKGEFDSYASEIKQYYDIMVNKKFLPNTPALANFGNWLGMGSACFVLDIEDSIDSIMQTLANAAIIFKAGGGVGYNFSKLRPEGDYVRSTSGIASGPVSFMRLFDTMTEVIKQGGIRRGANMGILNIDHPDIEKFIKAKEGNKALRNFNISVLIKPEFWDYYKENKPFPLINPRNGQVVRYVNPRQLFDMIAYQAWESAEPGVIFLDRVNEFNPFLKLLGPIVTTNPCGEVLLYPNESCNLGSINVHAFVKEDVSGNPYFDWDQLKEAIFTATKFLDNVIDVNKYPLKAIENMTLATRKIGLGVMGLADLLFELGIPYDTDEGREFMEKLMEFINYYSKKTSVELAKERGPMPYFKQSSYADGQLPFRGFYERSKSNLDWVSLSEEIKQYGIRNGYTTIIAPTGSISMIAGCSSGIEPVYSLVYEKNVTIGSFFYIDPVFEKVMKREGLLDDDMIHQVVANNGSIRSIQYIPERLRKIFVTAMDIAPIDHVKAIAAFQKWVDSSISKTTNLPYEASVEDIKTVYFEAYKLGCKDVTVFRDKSIKSQVLQAPPTQSSHVDTKPNPPQLLVSVEQEYNSVDLDTSTTCPVCHSKLEFKEGCATCPSCGFSYCPTA
ncbi:MAG: adenosylcobalamin-dependent ribonucleoside-diphosphate reductase [Conexivisphaerales archaeon]